MNHDNKKRMFKKKYNSKRLDYVMVDEKGDLIKPDYITYAHLDLSSKNLSLETLTNIIKIK